MTHAPAACGSRRRVDAGAGAAPAARRRARSIGGCAGPVRSSTVGPTARRASSAGPQAPRLGGQLGDERDVAVVGSAASVEVERWRRPDVVGDLAALAVAGDDERVGAPSARRRRPLRPLARSAPATLDAATCSDGDRLLQRRRVPRRSAAAAMHVDAVGQRRGRAAAAASSSTVDRRRRRRRSTSRYSASDSCPVDRASPKLTLGRGEKPSV